MGLVLGLVALLFHAAFDRDVQFRRLYMGFGFAAILVGAFLCLVPWREKMGDQFNSGFLCISLALLYLLAFLRNETDPAIRERTQYVLGAAGLAMSAIGLGGGCIKGEFLLPYGALLGILGLCYLGAFIASRGVSNDNAYYAGLGLGAGGLLVIVVAVCRSIFHGPGNSFLLPYGMLLIGLGAVAMIISWLLCSEDKVAIVTRRELGSFFFTPVAYFVLFGFTLAAAISFIWFVNFLNSRQTVPEPIVSRFVFGLSPIIVFIFAVPALTMRLFSEEKRTGTLEVMLTTPLNETALVLGKFFASLIMFQLVWVPFALFLVALRVMVGKPFDYWPLLAFFVGLIMSGGALLALGLFCSSITPNQLVSGVLSFAGMMLFTFAFIIKDNMLQGENATEGIPLVLEHINYIDVWYSTLQGKLIPAQMIFQGSLIIIFLFLTVKVLDVRKWS
jgi:ABC-2 type transport system permease protein